VTEAVAHLPELTEEEHCTVDHWSAYLKLEPHCISRKQEQWRRSIKQALSNQGFTLEHMSYVLSTEDLRVSDDPRGRLEIARNSVES
jgi:hypothetical protein